MTSNLNPVLWIVKENKYGLNNKNNLYSKSTGATSSYLNFILFYFPTDSSTNLLLNKLTYSTCYSV